jgi:hypothetical protein
MSVELTEADRELLQAPNYAWIVTLNPDGSTPMTPTSWSTPRSGAGRTAT